MKNMLRLFVSHLTALLVTICALPAAAAPPEPGGIAGTTVISHPPGSPPYTFVPGVPWVSEPVAASFKVIKAGSEVEVGWVVTGADGSFDVPLRPGRYVLIPDALEDGCYFPTGPIEVHVKGHQVTPVTISYYWFCFVIPF